MTNYLYKRGGSSATKAQKITLVWAACLLSIIASGQSRYTVSGTIRDKRTGETLIGATVSLLETKTPERGILSNAYGFYSVTAPAGHYTLLVT
ncbi:MAG TPA: carboxypeptidase regulatory-like domain-containing protein, partial [Puia sp.]|nr:carboxypeptidase regulatory-like domain-containing protein [Puia sp.]